MKSNVIIYLFIITLKNISNNDTYIQTFTYVIK